MDAYEWLKKNNKTPWFFGGAYYWASAKDVLPNNEDYEDEKHFLLPDQIHSKLSSRHHYPNCYVYESEQEAIHDFVEAFCELPSTLKGRGFLLQPQLPLDQRVKVSLIPSPQA